MSQLVRRRKSSTMKKRASKIRHAPSVPSQWIRRHCALPSLRRKSINEHPKIIRSTSLHALGKVYKLYREMPYYLTEAQTQHRVETCQKLLENPRVKRFIRRIVTCDEK